MTWRSLEQKASFNRLASGTRPWDHSRSGTSLIRPRSGQRWRSYSYSNRWTGSDSGYSYKQKMDALKAVVGGLG